MKKEIALLRVAAEKLFEKMMKKAVPCDMDALIRIIDKINELEQQQAWNEALKEVFVEPNAPDSELKEGDLTDEVYRVYDIPGRDEPYRIFDPVTLFTCPGGTMHRVLDRDGKVHCIPFPGNGTVLRWKPHDPENPVQF